ncbi:MAG: hypothetical protein R3F21_09040 [Myxococcota bacterium]
MKTCLAIALQSFLVETLIRFAPALRTSLQSDEEDAVIGLRIRLDDGGQLSLTSSCRTRADTGDASSTAP